jgi:hypothetical protein
MKLNSLELRWIHKKAKDLLYPDVLYVPKLENKSGCFYHPNKKQELLVGNRIYDLSKGLILISESDDSRELPNTIAHEWRHYWQFCKMGKIKGIPFDNKIPYQKAIKKFFEYSIERDALLFSHKFAPSPLSDYWMGLI